MIPSSSLAPAIFGLLPKSAFVGVWKRVNFTFFSPLKVTFPSSPSQKQKIN